MELLKQQAESGGCGSGCACHPGTSSGKVRWGICAVVLLVAGVLVARGVNKTDDASAKTASSGFAVPAVTSEATPPVAATPPEASANADAPPATAMAGAMIGAFQELNTVAMKSDAVFVYLPGKDAGSANSPAPAMDAAVRTIGAKGPKCGIFTLKPGSPDYDKLTGQMELPGVLTLVKGKGMSATSGEITETKLVQSYVAASSSGGCGSGGGGCGPASSGCN